MNRESLVKRASRATDPLFARANGVTILLYHRVGGGSDSDVDLAVDEFRRQLAHLAEHTTVLTLDAAVARLRDTRAASAHDRAAARHAVVITFDDGTADFADHAVPALVDAGLPAVLYVATEFIDRQTPFPWGAPPTSWAGLRDAAATGLVTIGSHTHRHLLLDRAADHDIASDLDRSIDLIATHLGTAPRHFAYPKAIPGSPAAEIAVRRRFTSAVLAGNRTNPVGSDLHRLGRSPVQRSDGHAYFVRKAHGGMRLEGSLRHAVARIKYAGRTT